MTLYISNSTTQRFVFHYREDFTVGDQTNSLLRAIEIDSGRQVEIGHGWSHAKTQAIIDQLERFGAHDAAEAHRKVPRFHGLLYRHEGQISEDEILMGHDSVRKMKEERTVEQTVKAALGMDRAANPQKGSRRTKSTEVTVKQVLPPGQRATGNEVDFSFAVDAERGAAKLVTTAQ